MDAFFHIVGICPDTHSHFDLIDFLLIGGSSVPFFAYIKYKYNNLKRFIKNRNEQKRIIKKTKF